MLCPIRAEVKTRAFGEWVDPLRPHRAVVQTKLLLISLAGGTASVLSNLLEDGKSNCSDYRDDNEQFGQRKPIAFFKSILMCS